MFTSFSSLFHQSHVTVPFFSFVMDSAYLCTTIQKLQWWMTRHLSTALLELFQQLWNRYITVYKMENTVQNYINNKVYTGIFRLPRYVVNNYIFYTYSQSAVCPPPPVPVAAVALSLEESLWQWFAVYGSAGGGGSSQAISGLSILRPYGLWALTCPHSQLLSHHCIESHPPPPPEERGGT